jgi:hypothetical protein
VSIQAGEGRSIKAVIDEHGTWEWDHSDISNAAVVYRRVLARPDHLAPDLEGGPPKPMLAALKWDVGDGISMYRDELLKELGLTPLAVKKNNDDHVYCFRVGSLRRANAGYIDEPDEADAEKGKAHGLVRCDERQPAKSRTKEIRNEIIAACWPFEQAEC